MARPHKIAEKVFNSLLFIWTGFVNFAFVNALDILLKIDPDKTLGDQWFKLLCVSIMVSILNYYIYKDFYQYLEAIKEDKHV